MKKNQHYIIGVAIALTIFAAFLITFIMADTVPKDHDKAIPQNPENQNHQPVIIVRENTTFIDIHHKEGMRVLLYAEEPKYPAIKAECLEQIHCINAQIKTGFSRADLNAMKHNGTYVAINFSVPATFETSYIIDGSPKMITIDEAIFFLDSGYEDIIITPMQNGTGVWDTSRDRGIIGDLVF